MEGRGSKRRKENSESIIGRDGERRRPGGQSGRGWEGQRSSKKAEPRGEKEKRNPVTDQGQRVRKKYDSSKIFRVLYGNAWCITNKLDELAALVQECTHS